MALSQQTSRFFCSEIINLIRYILDPGSLIRNESLELNDSVELDKTADAVAALVYEKELVLPGSLRWLILPHKSIPDALPWLLLLLGLLLIFLQNGF